LRTNRVFNLVFSDDSDRDILLVIREFVFDSVAARPAKAINVTLLKALSILVENCALRLGLDERCLR